MKQQDIQSLKTKNYKELKCQQCYQKCVKYIVITLNTLYCENCIPQDCRKCEMYKFTEFQQQLEQLCQKELEEIKQVESLYQNVENLLLKYLNNIKSYIENQKKNDLEYKILYNDYFSYSDIEKLLKQINISYNSSNKFEICYSNVNQKQQYHDQLTSIKQFVNSNFTYINDLFNVDELSGRNIKLINDIVYITKDNLLQIYKQNGQNFQKLSILKLDKDIDSFELSNDKSKISITAPDENSIYILQQKNEFNYEIQNKLKFVDVITKQLIVDNKKLLFVASTESISIYDLNQINDQILNKLNLQRCYVLSEKNNNLYIITLDGYLYIYDINDITQMNLKQTINLDGKALYMFIDIQQNQILIGRQSGFSNNKCIIYILPIKEGNISNEKYERVINSDDFRSFAQANENQFLAIYENQILLYEIKNQSIQQKFSQKFTKKIKNCYLNQDDILYVIGQQLWFDQIK